MASGDCLRRSTPEGRENSTGSLRSNSHCDCRQPTTRGRDTSADDILFTTKGSEQVGQSEPIRVRVSAHHPVGTKNLAKRRYGSDAKAAKKRSAIFRTVATDGRSKVARLQDSR